MFERIFGDSGMETENGLLEKLSSGKWKYCIEFLTLLYIGVEILYQEFRMCYFISYFLPLKEHLYLVEVYLLKAGLALTAANVLVSTGWRRSRRVAFLYGILLLDALSSFMAVGGVELAWILQLTREITTVVLFYCAAQSVRKDLLGRLLHLFYWLWLLFWGMMCCLSLCQFALMLCDDTRITHFMQLLGPGYYGHRLFGVFTWPEFGAMTSLLIMLAGGYYFVSTHSGMERILLALSNAPLLFYLVLSRSRNAQTALYLSLILATVIVCFKGTSGTWVHGRRGLMAIAVAFAVVAGAHLGYITILHTAECIPILFTEYSASLAQDSSVQSPSAEEGKETSVEETGREDGLLERIDTQGDISTNRFIIWKDYISLWKEYGLFGLSSTYDSQYIQEHHPDLFICKYNVGSVYHPHNGYLKTLVSTGYLGFTFLMLFLLGSVRDVWKAICRSEKIRPKLLFPLLIAVAGCISAVFDLELFFVFNPISYLFWLALGALMMQMQAGEVKEARKAETRIK